VPADLQAGSLPAGSPVDAVAPVSDLILNRDQKVLVTNWLMARAALLFKRKYEPAVENFHAPSAAAMQHAVDDAVNDFVGSKGLAL